MPVRTITMFLLVLSAICGPMCPAETPPLAPGDSVADLEFQTLYDDQVTLRDIPNQRAYVLFFFSNTCPVARRYMGRIAELAARFHDDGVQFIAINASPADTLVDVAQHALSYGLEFPVVNDPTFDTVRALGVTRTPEVVVLDEDYTLRYRGRIDDQYRLGGVRPQASRPDLALALEAILAGKPVATPETPAEGCIITYPMLPKPGALLDFDTDIYPILAEFCISCHVSEGSAPFPLDTSSAVREQKAGVLRVLLTDRMPPSFVSRESDTVQLHRLPYRAQHQLANWLHQDPVSKAAVPTGPRPKATGVGGALARTVNEQIIVTGEGQVTDRLVGPPVETDTWLTYVAVRGDFDLGFHYAQLYCEIPGDDRSKQLLTGPVLPGMPLVWEGDGALRVPPGAALGLRVHYRPGGTSGSDQPVLLARHTTTSPSVEIRMEHQPLNVGDTSGERTLPMPGSLRAVAIHVPRRGYAVMVKKVTGNEEMDLLSLPAAAPDWPITYSLRKNTTEPVPGATVSVRTLAPGYLQWPGVSGPPLPGQLNASARIDIYWYWERSR